jgi:hypothetical protein
MYVVLLGKLAKVVTPLICIYRVPNYSFGWDTAYGGKICVAILSHSRWMSKTKTKLRGLSPRANYTDRAAAAGRRS